MSRIRTIKPEFWRHEDLSELSEATHIIAAALLNHADDEGYFNANHKLVKAECCPLREPTVSVQDSLVQLAAIGYLRLGTGCDGKRYGQVVKFTAHQRINRPTESKIKELQIVWDDSRHAHSRLSEESHREGKGREQGRELEQTLPPAGGGALEAGSSTISQTEVTPTVTEDDPEDIPAGLDRREYPQAYSELWDMYREEIGEKNSSKSLAFQRWKKLSKADQDACYFGLVEYCLWAKDERKKRPDVPLKHLEVFINKRSWEPYLEKAA